LARRKRLKSETQKNRAGRKEGMKKLTKNDDRSRKESKNRR
jgi:hypothetical protein